MVDDTALALRAADGDSEAFALLLSRNYDRIFRLAFRILGRREDAEDLVQDIAMTLPRKLGSFRGDARFSTWLHRVTLNAARDLVRRQATRAKAGDRWGDWETARRAVADEARDAQDWLIEAMNSLKPDLRETVALVLGEDASHAEAAEILDVSEGTISWRMSEVRKALRAQAKREETL